MNWSCRSHYYFLCCIVSCCLLDDDGCSFYDCDDDSTWYLDLDNERTDIHTTTAISKRHEIHDRFASTPSFFYLYIIMMA